MGKGQWSRQSVDIRLAYFWSMTFTKGPTISFTYDEVLALATQLSPKEQQRLTKELARKRMLELMDEMRPKKPVPQKEILKAARASRKRVQARQKDETASGRR